MAGPGGIVQVRVHVHVGPSGGSASTGSATYRAELAYAQCMQTHCLPGFPDPNPSAAFSIRRKLNANGNSPAARANDACQHLLPAGRTGTGGATAPAAASPPGAAATDCLASRPPCYTPRQLRAAYGIQPLLDRGIDGRGVTVVLPEEAETGPAQGPAVTDIRQDVADFDSRFGLPPARIQVIRTTLAGSSVSPWLAGLEEVEDTELVHAVAGDATIRELLVDPADVSTPAKLAATFAAYVRIAARNGQVISQSGIGQDFNLGEDSWTGAEVATMNSALEYAAARHVTVVAASGDEGVLGNGSSAPVKEVILPTSDPLVLAAGGTSLTANPVTGAYISETAWNTHSRSTRPRNVSCQLWKSRRPAGSRPRGENLSTDQPDRTLGVCQPRQQSALRPAAAHGLGAQSRPVEHRQADDAVARGAAIAKCRYRRRDSDPLC
jgi:hypothetical protein